MKRTKRFWHSLGWFAAFAAWTALVCFADVRPIGPLGTSVGLGGINQWVHTLTGVHFALYDLTDWLGLVPIAVCMGFGVLGLVQWIRRKDLRKVDADILALGGFYAVTVAAFVLFEVLAVNYRPVLIDGVPEASYPSSTTLLVMCVMPTAMLQLHKRMQKKWLRRFLLLVLAAFTAFMVVGRLICGVHWFSDIVGGGLLSAGLVTLYAAVCDIV